MLVKVHYLVNLGAVGVVERDGRGTHESTARISDRIYCRYTSV